MMNDYNFTKNMHGLFEEKMLKLYSREDFEKCLKELKKADNSERPSRKAKLKRICKTRDIDPAELWEDWRAKKDESILLKKIPDREGVKEELMEILHDIYLEFPKSSDYMERIVRELAPEYNHDTVRTAILKKFVKGSGVGVKKSEFKTEEIAKWAQQHFTVDEKEAYENASAEEKLEMIVEKIDDSIFTEDRMNIRLNKFDILEVMVKTLEKCEEDSHEENSTIKVLKEQECKFTDLDVKESTREKLLAFIEKYEISHDEKSSMIELLANIVSAYKSGKLSKEEADDQMEMFWESLEEDFENMMKITTYEDKNKKRRKLIVKYRDNRDDARDRKGEEWKLLRYSDDYATGRFKNNGGKTKELLYYFAFMFEMTVKIKDSDVYDANTDISKNLFEDYYSDNLLRYLEEEYSNPKTAGGYEKEPSGEGINYKNYAECIYLYYLYHKKITAKKNEELIPGQRIFKANSLINKCVSEAKKREKAGEKIIRDNPTQYTYVYKERYIDEMLNLNEEELVDYVLKHYLVLSSDNAGGARILVASKPISTSEFIDKKLDELEEAEMKDKNSYVLDADIETLEDSVKIAMTEKKKIELTSKDKARLSENTDTRGRVEEIKNRKWRLASLLHEKYSEDEEFLRVIDGIQDRLVAGTERSYASDPEFLANLLLYLYQNTDAENKLSMHMVNTYLEEEAKEPLATERTITAGINILKMFGLDILNDDKGYALGNRMYEDEELDSLMKCLKGRRSTKPQPKDKEIGIIKKLRVERVDKKLSENRRVTRSELLAIYMAEYAQNLTKKKDAPKGGWTFQKLYEDYMEEINPYLEDGRYQTLNVKNIFDMYIVLQLYFCIDEEE